WAEVLRVERVGRHDNFFELGGHSLLAVQIVARIQTSLRSDLTIRRVFSHPTLTSMASLIAGESRAQSTSSLAEIDAFMDNLEAV
ncbi:phosphopantetheine-binding protein, partial [Acidovorax facilis]